MSNAAHEAALQALRDAEAALALAEKAEVSAPADGSAGALGAVAAAPTADVRDFGAAGDLPTRLDLGPDHLGPVAINGG